jgi:predicted outer membrane repeat protein
MVLAGLTIRGAQAAASGDVSTDGGAVYCAASSPTIRNCVFDTCGSPSRGGAIAIVGSHPHSDPDIRECRFVGNRAGAGGGAVYLANTDITLHNCTFQGNSARDGGAVLVETDSPRNAQWRNCMFDANYATQRGGAICTGADIAASMLGCTFSNNVAQEGGGLRVLSSGGAVLTNCIVWGNRDAGGTGETAQIRTDQSAFLRYSHVQGWTGLMNGLFATGRDPLLLDVDGPDDDPATWQDNELELTRFSMCISGADPDLSYLGQTDAAGQPRLQSCQADIGAYESAYSWPPADIDGDCRVDVSDLEHFVLCGTGAGVPILDPVCSDADLDRDGDVDVGDFALFQRCWSGPDRFSIRNCMD